MSSKPVLRNKIFGHYGVRESTELELVADTNTGETSVVVTKTISKSYKVKDYGKAVQMYEKLTRSGRIEWTLENISE